MTGSLRRSIVTAVAVAALAIGVSGCIPSARPSEASHDATSPTSSGLTTGPAAPAGMTRTPEAAWTGIPNTAVLLVARPGDESATIIDAATGRDSSGPELRIPLGVPGPDWGRVVSARVSDSTTVLRDDVVQPGFGGPSLELDGRWRLPSVGDGDDPVGVSADGSTIVLVEDEPRSDRATTRFSVVQHDVLGTSTAAGDADLRLVRTVELRGAFSYDALSSDGRILYVIEHLEAPAGGHYQVRAVDLPAGLLREAVIVDKANPDERMAGYPIAQIRRSDGVVMTLYDGPEHPFIHALQSNEGWALCIDLPTAPGADRSGWGLAAAPDGRTVFAANGHGGIVIELDPDEYAVRRIAGLPTTAESRFTLAKFGHTDVGPVGARVVALPDGSGLLVAMRDGVAVVSGKDLRETTRVATGTTVDAIGVTPDGSAAFGLTRDGRIVAFDPRSGRLFGEVAGGPYARLLAVAPG